MIFDPPVKAFAYTIRLRTFSLNFSMINVFNSKRKIELELMTFPYTTVFSATIRKNAKQT